MPMATGTDRPKTAAAAAPAATAPPCPRAVEREAMISCVA